jgi:hypothetical protein
MLYVQEHYDEYLPSKIVEIISEKVDALGALRISHGRGEDCRCTFTGKPKGERILGFNVGSRNTEYEYVFWINLALGRNHWRLPANTVTNQ